MTPDGGRRVCAWCYRPKVTTRQWNDGDDFPWCGTCVVDWKHLPQPADSDPPPSPWKVYRGSKRNEAQP